MGSQITDKQAIKSWLNCARFGRLPEIKAHMAAGIDIDSAKSLGYTALIHALNHGQDDVGLLLLHAGADPLIQTTTGLRALDCAAEHGCL